MKQLSQKQLWWQRRFLYLCRIRLMKSIVRRMQLSNIATGSEMSMLSVIEGYINAMNDLEKEYREESFNNYKLGETR